MPNLPSVLRLWSDIVERFVDWCSKGQPRRFGLALRMCGLGVLLAAQNVALAQATPDVERGLHAFGSYQGGAIDQVNLSNQGLFVQAGLFDYSQRGNELDYRVVLRYNNKNFSYYQQPCPAGAKLGTTECPLRMFVIFGPNPLRVSRASEGDTVSIGFEGFPSTAQSNIDTSLQLNGNDVFVHPASVMMPDGSVRQLATTNSGTVALDGSGFATNSNTLMDGKGVTYPGNLGQDANGNYITANADGSWTDSLGRQIPPLPGPSSPNVTASPSTASLSACPVLNYAFQPVTYAYTWNLPTVNGGTLPLVLCYTSVFVRTGQPQTPPIFAVNQAFTMLQSVVFADDNTYWAFQYDAADPNNTASYAWGDLLKITFPTGGTITYTWAPVGSCGSNLDRGVQTRTVDAGDGTGSHTWTYSPGVVTDPEGNDTVHTFTGLGGTCSLYETQTQYFQGSHSSGTLLKTVKTDYQFTQNPYDPGTIGGGGVEGNAATVTNVFPIRVTTILPNGLVSKVEMDYDTALAYHGPLDGVQSNVQSCMDMVPGDDTTKTCWYLTPDTNPVTNYTGSYGKVVAKREYDWAQGAPGPLLRQTLITYQWQVNGAYLSNNFMDLPASVQVLDGSGSQVALTNYAYDEYPLASSGIGTQHNSTPPNGTVRGNVTSVSRQVTTNSFVTVHTKWYDTGVPFQDIDALGNITTHTYDPAYAGAYVTETCAPSTGGGAVAHCTSGTYDFNTGLLTSFTNENATQQANGNTPGDAAHTSSYSYDDRWRLTSALSPPDPTNGSARASTSFTYSAANASPMTVLRQRSVTAGLMDSRTVDFDKLGRPYQTQHATPVGNALVDTIYDPLGRAASVSNAYFQGSSHSSDPTYGITQSQFDALGRVTQVTKQDGSVVSTQYDQTSSVSPNGNCAIASDEAGNPRKSCFDGLGRMIEVDEPTAGTSATSGSGSVTITGGEGVIPAVAGQGNVTLTGQVQWKTVSSSASTQTGGTTSITISGQEQQYPPGATQGTGGVTFSGAEQVIPATTANGSVTINGTLQSTQVLTQAATAATGSVTINGSEKSTTVTVRGRCTIDPYTGLESCIYTTTTTYDSGTVTITVNGHADSYSFGQNDTTSSVAAGLVNAINGDGSSSVSANLSGSTVNLTARSTGAGTDYSLSVSVSSGMGSFAGTSASGAALGGGQNAVYTTVYDSGTCTVTANNHGDSTSPAWSGSGTTAASIATSLASSINADGAASVKATASGSTVSLTAQSSGAAGNVSLSSTCTYDTGHFSHASFTTSNSGSTLTGGKNSVYDSGTFTLTVNNTSPPYTAGWGQGDTPSAIAAKLANNINNVVTGGPVTASASGATVTLTSKVSGGISNYTMTLAGSHDGGDFSGSSFSGSLSGPALTGGAPPAIATDSGTITVMVNSQTYQATWGAGDTSASIASNLVKAMAADPSVAPQLSASGTTVYITPKVPGTLYTSSTTYAFDTAHTGHFAQSSFTPANAISDWGTVTVTANNHTDVAPWAGLDTPATIGAALATKINGDSAASVRSSASAGVVTLTAKTAGAATDYAFTAAAASSDQTDFSVSSFSAAASGAQLGGGTDAIYDAGSVTLTVGGFSATAPYQQGSTPASLASALANAINAPNSGSPVTAGTSGGTLNLIAAEPGAAGNYSVSATSATSKPAQFPQPSFTVSGSALSGGANAVAGSFSSPLVTLYTYDTLGNLRNVTQEGGTTDQTQWRVRTFAYDSISRLLTATNPESGTISYQYDANGNVLSKTSPASNQTGSATQIISYCYDALNRLAGKGYGAQPCPLTTAAVTYTYDQGGAAANAIGHMTSLTDQAGSATYTYDLLGRIATEQRTIAGISKNMSYAYNLDGSLKTVTYPSGAAVTYTPWNNGTVAVGGASQSAVDIGNNINYVTGANYQAGGQIVGFTSGASGSFAGIVNSFSYNQRLQPVNTSAGSPTATVLSLNYDFHLGAGDNGNVYEILNNKDSSRDQSFTYDGLNRLISAQNAGTDCSQSTVNGKSKFWGDTYVYDAWGNLVTKNATKCQSEGLDRTADAQNRLHVKTGADFQYDAAGNITYDTTGLYYTYDQENRINAAGGFTYAYDADSNRVGKSSGSSGTLYWYMALGIVAESDLAGNVQHEYIFFGGKRVARRDETQANAGVFYYFSDRLNSASVITDSAGNIKAESDYYPWGGELQFSNNDGNDYKFTGQKMDGETGLDYFGARYYSSSLGRFLSPDWSASPQAVPYANLGNPQTLNLYSYVDNNPSSGVDPGGHFAVSCEALSTGCSPFPSLAPGGGGTADELWATLSAWELALARSRQQPPSWCGASKCEIKNGRSRTTYTASDDGRTLTVTTTQTITWVGKDSNGQIVSFGTIDTAVAVTLSDVQGAVSATQTTEARGMKVLSNGDVTGDPAHSWKSSTHPIDIDSAYVAVGLTIRGSVEDASFRGRTTIKEALDEYRWGLQQQLNNSLVTEVQRLRMEVEIERWVHIAEGLAHILPEIP